MMDATINYKATVTVGSELREIGGNETVEVQNIVTGSQTVGTSYEALAATSLGNSIIFLYNAGSVDVSVRVRLSHFSINEYQFFTLIPGGIFAVPYAYLNDESRVAVREALHARSASGTATIEYCHLL